MDAPKITTYFAPMEGITGYVYRRIHREIFKGPDCYYSPFLSPTQNHLFTPKEMREILPENNAGIRMVPQLMTNKAEDFLWAAGELKAMGYEEVNLNLGCPSGTVVAKKKGSGFLTDPDALDEFFEEVFGRAEISISVKTRLGRYDGEEFDRLLEIYNKYPISLLTVHPRVQTDFYKNAPDRNRFREALSTSKNPVCYNGNLYTPKDYRSFLDEFPGCRHVMMGRGLVANPALMESIEGAPRDREKLREFHRRIYEAYRELIPGDRNLLYKMKELWFYMIRTFGDSERMAKKIRKTERLAEYEELVRQVFDELEILEDYDLGI